ncbi:MAG: GtrA family protein [Xanthomonadales bacterium]|nr:GtrA family protein [Xanthomonadales bacterium]
MLSGGLATAAHYFIMWCALSFQSRPVVATSVGFFAGATVRFFFSYFHIFEPERNVIDALPHFILSLLLQMILNAALLAILLTFTTMVWPAQVMTTIGLTILNFLMYKYWVFK